MKITIITTGSRGDIQPYIALGVGLKAAGHEVKLTTHGVYEEWITGHGLDFAPVEGNPLQMIASGDAQEWIESGQNLLKFWGQFRRLLKPLLLDQSFVAGLGNIYVDEALHTAGLHPLSASHRVSRSGAASLAAAIKRVLRRAIAAEGSSFDAFYRTPEGRPGRYQDGFLVYGRDGLPCRRCGATIVRLVVGQRGTHVCPRCQPLPSGSTPSS